MLFLASMRPSLQREVLAQSRARLVGANSMTDYTGPQREAVREVAHACDVLFLNESELASLTGAPVTTWRQEAIAMCGVGRLRAVVVKGGPKGRVAGHRRRCDLAPRGEGRPRRRPDRRR